MNETTHEPGPWTFDAASGQIRNADGNVLATVPHAIAGDEHAAANGRLMARAPELQDLVRDLAAALEDHHTGTAQWPRPWKPVKERDRALLVRARAVLR